MNKLAVALLLSLWPAGAWRSRTRWARSRRGDGEERAAGDDGRAGRAQT